MKALQTDYGAHEICFTIYDLKLYILESFNSSRWVHKNIHFALVLTKESGHNFFYLNWESRLKSLSFIIFLLSRNRWKRPQKCLKKNILISIKILQLMSHDEDKAAVMT